LRDPSRTSCWHEAGAGLVVDEPIDSNGRTSEVGTSSAQPNITRKVGIGREVAGFFLIDESDEHAFVPSLEEAGEGVGGKRRLRRGRARFSAAFPLPVCAGIGTFMVPPPGWSEFLVDRRGGSPSTEGPRSLYIRIASWPYVNADLADHPVAFPLGHLPLPFALRDETIVVALVIHARAAREPQKHGTYFSTSG
jgi:hypothetical protein